MAKNPEGSVSVFDYDPKTGKHTSVFGKRLKEAQKMFEPLISEGDSKDKDYHRYLQEILRQEVEAALSDDTNLCFLQACADAQRKRLLLEEEGREANKREKQGKPKKDIQKDIQTEIPNPKDKLRELINNEKRTLAELELEIQKRKENKSVHGTEEWKQAWREEIRLKIKRDALLKKIETMTKELDS